MPSFVLAATDPYRPEISRVVAVLAGARQEPIEAAIGRALADPPEFEPPLKVHSVELSPTTVAAGEWMTLEWELTATGGPGEGSVGVELSYVILQSGNALYRSEPREVRMVSGRRARHAARVRAAAPGEYRLAAVARLGTVEQVAEKSFRVH